MDIKLKSSFSDKQKVVTFGCRLNFFVFMVEAFENKQEKDLKATRLVLAL